MLHVLIIIFQQVI